jgi:hypothetical protein
MNKLLIGLVTAVVTLGVVLGTLIATKGYPTRQEKPIKQETKTEKNYTEVDLNTLMTELKENALNAAEKYKGKDVKIVHGVLKNIDSDGDYISLNGDQNKLNIVHNMMVMTKSKEVKDQVRQLKVGQSLIIYGHIDDVGEVIGYKVHADKIEIAAEQSAATPTPAAEMRRMEDMPSPAQLKQNQSKEWRPLSSDKRYGYRIFDKGALTVHDNQMNRNIVFLLAPKEYDLDLSKGVLYISMWTYSAGNSGEDWTIDAPDPDIPSQYRPYYIILKAEFSWEGGRIRPGMLTRAPVPTYGTCKPKATPQGVQELYYPYNVPLQEQASVDVINAVLRDLPRLKQEGL